MRNPPFKDLENADASTIRGFINALEQVCSEDPRQLDIGMEHHFSHNVYARTMNLPAGAMIIGKIHKQQNLSIISKGEVSVLTDQGVRRIKAPEILVAPAGVKRVIYAHEDSKWTVVHGTTLKDVDQIENEFIAQTYDEVMSLEPQGDDVEILTKGIIR